MAADSNGTPNLDPEKAVQRAMRERALQLEGKGKQPQKVDDEEFSNQYPALASWLGATQIGEAFNKEPARLSLNMENGQWRVSLNDQALDMSLTVFGPTLKATLDVLDRLVLSHDAPWVRFKKRGHKKLEARQKKREKRGRRQ